MKSWIGAIGLLCLGLGFALGQTAPRTSVGTTGWYYNYVPSSTGVGSFDDAFERKLDYPPAYIGVVSGLTSCTSANAYQFAVVTDASSPTYNGTLTGGSSTTTLAWCDGSNWRAH